MTELEPSRSATTRGLTVSPSLELVVEAAQVPPESAVITMRTLQLAGLAMCLGIVSAFAAQVLVALIGLITNLAFFGRWSMHEASPAEAVPHLGAWVILIPIFGAVLVGLMARYGSKAIRGHGIPEAMEQILTNESRIPPRVTLLKPMSAAVSIGTGGPFGAEGPIIATGAAIGSVLGQVLRTTPSERKILLAAGAAAGMAATFGSPVSAVLLAIELLLFEFRPRSLIPVAMAAATASGVRMVFEGMEPVFQMTNLTQPSGAALVSYITLGALMGIAAVIVTKLVYAIEDGFEKLPIHWMWWPAIGGVAVGITGYLAPDTLGVGYYNISRLLSSELALPAVVFLCGMKFISWSISLGSGTSGGTLAPLLTIGGGLGTMVGSGLQSMFPAAEIDLRIAALVGMASLFAGASRALLASAVFAFETTLQPLGLLPLLGGCAAAYLISSLLMRNSIMTEKIARRGVRTPVDYEADPMEQVPVSAVMSTQVVALSAQESLSAVRTRLAAGDAVASHQGFPVLDEKLRLVGVVTRRDILSLEASDELQVHAVIKKLPRYVYEDCTVRQAADHLVNHDIGRLPVVQRKAPHRVVGMITRSDILSVFLRRIKETEPQEPEISFLKRRGTAVAAGETVKTA